MNDSGARSRDDGIRHLIEAVIRAGGFEIEAHAAGLQGAAGDFGVLPLYSARDVIDGHAEPTHAREIQRNAHLGLRRAPDLDLPHAVHALEQVLQVARAVGQFAVGNIANQRKLHDVGQPRLALADSYAVHGLRQLRPQAVHLANDLVILAVHVWQSPVEFDVDERNAGIGGRFDLLDVVQFVERVFYLVRDEFLDLGCLHAGCDGDDGEERCVKTRVLGTRH